MLGIRCLAHVQILIILPLSASASKEASRVCDELVESECPDESALSLLQIGARLQVSSNSQMGQDERPLLAFRATSSNQYMQSQLAKLHHENMPEVAWRAFETIAEEKRKLLEVGSEDGVSPQHPKMRGHVFEAVEVSLPLEPPVLKHPRTKGSGQGDKNIVGLSELTRGGRKCIVYGIGIANDSGFEQQMQHLGCETHAFDCTIKPEAGSVAGKAFKFHNWCIGEKEHVDMSKIRYVHADEGGAKLPFKTLSETMRELGHTHIDLLKFDIEGFEWQLFQTEILTSKNPPEQLSFELHTEKANPEYVPAGNVKGKDFVQVNRLFKSLFDMGYRVTSKELNDGDPACAEFVAIKVDRALAKKDQ